jgi:hypothetical protein
MVATSAAVYVGGSFATVNSVGKAQIVLLSPSTGAIISGFTAASDGASVTAMIMSPDASTLIVAGRFAKLDGTARTGMGGVNPTTGALMAWSTSWPIKDNAVDASLTALRTDGTNIWHVYCLCRAAGIWIYGRRSPGRSYQDPAQPFMRPSILEATENWRPQVMP